MRKQILLGAAVGVLCGLFALPISAQTTSIVANVPFTFSVGEKTYPAGEYTFIPTSDKTLILEKDGRLRVALITANSASGKASSSGEVRFECYDAQCFLSQIWIPGREEGFGIVRSHLETEIAAKSTGRYLSLLTKPQRP